MSRTIAIRRQWDGALLQTAELVPERSVAVLLDYPVDLEPVDLEVGDGDLPPLLAEALAQGLAACGTVAGRWLDESAAVPAEAVLWPAERQTLMGRFIGRLGHTSPVPVVTTRSPAVVFDLLNVGWSMQSQALLVLGPEEALESAAAAVQALSVTRDWQAFSFPEPARALVAPGVDGDFILVAAASEEGLTEVLGCLAQAFRGAGFTVSG